MFHTASHTPPLTFVVELTCIERNEGRWVGGRSFEDDIFETINCLFHYFWKIWENELMYVPSRMAWLVGYTYKHTYICMYSIYTHIRRLRSPPIEVCSMMCCFPNFRHVVYGNTDAHTRTHTHTHTAIFRFFDSVAWILFAPLAFVVGKRLILLRANYVKIVCVFHKNLKISFEFPRDLSYYFCSLFSFQYAQ